MTNTDADASVILTGGVLHIPLIGWRGELRSLRISLRDGYVYFETDLYDNYLVGDDSSWYIRIRPEQAKTVGKFLVERTELSTIG